MWLAAEALIFLPKWSTTMKSASKKYRPLAVTTTGTCQQCFSFGFVVVLISYICNSVTADTKNAVQVKSSPTQLKHTHSHNFSLNFLNQLMWKHGAEENRVLFYNLNLKLFSVEMVISAKSIRWNLQQDQWLHPVSALVCLTLPCLSSTLSQLYPVSTLSQPYCLNFTLSQLCSLSSLPCLYSLSALLSQLYSVSTLLSRNSTLSLLCLNSILSLNPTASTLLSELCSVSTVCLIIPQYQIVK